MIAVVFLCISLVVLTTFVHYELLSAMSPILRALRIPARAKLVVVILATFMAHIVEISLYALAIYVVVSDLGLGTLGAMEDFSFSATMYFSAETYTSLGYGDVVPKGPLRLLAGVEALNGLLLIGWSASYTYISMERFWNREV